MGFGHSDGLSPSGKLRAEGSPRIDDLGLRRGVGRAAIGHRATRTVRRLPSRDAPPPGKGATPPPATFPGAWVSLGVQEAESLISPCV